MLLTYNIQFPGPTGDEPYAEQRDGEAVINYLSRWRMWDLLTAGKITFVTLERK